MGLLRGTPDGERPARAPITCSRACSRTSTRATRRCAATASSARAAGTATGCRWRSRSNSSSGITSKAEIEEYGIERFNAQCRESVFTFLEEWNRLTERIGFWLDLEHAYRTLDESYIESVWWALAEIDRAGPAVRGPQGRAVLPALRDDAVLARGRAGLQGRGRPARLPEAAVRSRPRRRGNRPASPPRRRQAAGVDDDAVDAAGQRRGGGLARRSTYARARIGGETLIARRGAGRARCSARTRRSSSASPARSWSGATAYEGPIFAATRPRAGRLPDPRGRLRDDGGRHGHRAPRAGVRRGRLPRRGARPGVVRPERAAHAVQPGQARRHLRRARAQPRRASYEGRFVKDPDADEGADRGPATRAACCCGVQDYEHSYPHCWRCGTPLIYYAKPSWYIATSKLRERAAGGERDGQLAPAARQARALRGLAEEQRRLGALARALLGHAAAGVALRRAGTSHVIGSFAELAERSGETLEDHHRPYVDEVDFPCPHGGEADGGATLRPGTMSRVPEVIDVWFDSGAMPFAQHHFPFEHDGSVRRALPGGLHLRGAGPDARLVLLAAGGRDAARPEAPFDAGRRTGTWCASA